MDFVATENGTADRTRPYNPTGLFGGFRKEKKVRIPRGKEEIKQHPTPFHRQRSDVTRRSNHAGKKGCDRRSSSSSSSSCFPFFFIPFFFTTGRLLASAFFFSLFFLLDKVGPRTLQRGLGDVVSRFLRPVPSEIVGWHSQTECHLLRSRFPRCYRVLPGFFEVFFFVQWGTRVRRYVRTVVLTRVKLFFKNFIQRKLEMWRWPVRACFFSVLWPAPRVGYLFFFLFFFYWRGLRPETGCNRPRSQAFVDVPAYFFFSSAWTFFLSLPQVLGTPRLSSSMKKKTKNVPP